MNERTIENITVGVLAMQGGYLAHSRMLKESLQVRTILVRTGDDLEQADALVLPGGESTTIIKLLMRIGLDEAIRKRVRAGMPIYGTCAGMILLAKKVQDRPEQPTLALMDIAVERNAFGSQVDSFEADVNLAIPASEPLSIIVKDALKPTSSVRGVFIRAPYVTEIGAEVEVLGKFNDKIVAVRQKNRLATAFHPELTSDSQVHEFFINIILKSEEIR